MKQLPHLNKKNWFNSYPYSLDEIGQKKKMGKVGQNIIKIQTIKEDIDYEWDEE